MQLSLRNVEPNYLFVCPQIANETVTSDTGLTSPTGRTWNILNSLSQSLREMPEMSTFRLGVVGGTSAKIDGCKLSLELTVSFRIVMREISHRANSVMYGLSALKDFTRISFVWFLFWSAHHIGLHHTPFSEKMKNAFNFKTHSYFHAILPKLKIISRCWFNFSKAEKRSYS